MIETRSGGTLQLERVSSLQPEGDYEGFCRMVQKHTGLNLTAYKRGQMERRIRAMAERSNYTDLRQYWLHIAKDPEQVQIFLDRVTINVSELFRNPEKFEELRLVILPALLRSGRPLSVWSAGCSYGAEAYSVKILLQKLAGTLNHRLWATDIDSGILARARKGEFTKEDCRNVPDLSLRQFFQPTGDGYRVIDTLRKGVEFERHDLLVDQFPQHIDLILCRNVVIYFNDEAKARLYERFYRALSPGGYLFVGSTERIFNAREIGFTNPYPFFYQKPVNG